LRPAASLGHPELHALPLTERGRPRGQRRRMHEDLAAVVAGEEAIPLVGVVPLDLAGRHAQTSRLTRTNNNQRSGDRQDAMGTSKAIGPGRRAAASLTPAHTPGNVTPKRPGEAPGRSA